MLSAVRFQGCLLAPVAAVFLTASLAFSFGLQCEAKTHPRAKQARQAAAPPLTPFEKAQRQRDALESKPEKERTRKDYDRVLDAYRAIYHSNPHDAKAADSIGAVAELLAQEGRTLQDEKASRDAIGQYEFLRKEYPYTKLRAKALLAQGDIYRQDLGDLDAAKNAYQLFLKTYPKDEGTDQARQALKQIKKDELAAQHSSAKNKALAAKNAPQPTETKPTSAPPHAKNTTEPQPAHTTPAPLPAEPANATAVTAMTPAPASLTKDFAADPAVVKHSAVPMLTGIRHWSTSVYTRVVIDLGAEVQYEAARVPNPDRIYFDLHGLKLSQELIGKSIVVTDDGFLKRIRAAQFSNDIARVVLDVSDVSDYSAFLLPNPNRLIIDIHGSKTASPQQTAKAPETNAPAPTPQVEKPQENIAANHAASKLQNNNAPSPSSQAATTTQSASSLKEVATLGSQPNRMKATKKPTTEPIAASVAGATPAPNQTANPAQNDASSTNQPPSQNNTKKSSKNGKHSPPPDSTVASSIHEAEPTAAGERSLVRALGLKIGRIVVDAGHGGHDSGTLGPEGIQEKEVVLDVALRVGKLLNQKLGADIIYTRDDDTFIPLETRTAIANKSQADLFLSIHANSSRDSSARGVETYYLNFTSSPDALEVAARENAVSQQSVHQLADLVKKITLKDKIEESREFAADVQASLYSGLQKGNPGLRDRGVKKAPFVVLIGANMPSILAEISFLTNPDDARQLRDGAYRQRIAESIYQGVAKYVGGLSSVKVAQSTNRGNGN